MTLETIWVLVGSNREVCDWIDDSLTATTYSEGGKAIIVNFHSEDDRMLFKLRWM